MHNILTDMVARKASLYGSREAMYHLDRAGRWVPVTWRELDRTVADAACGLVAMGLGEQESVAVFSANRPELIETDLAAFACRLIPVSIYATSSREQVEYIVRDSGARVIFAGNASQLAIARDVQQALGGQVMKIVTYGDDVTVADDDPLVMTFGALTAAGAAAPEECRKAVVDRRRAAAPDDIATLIYTSGTTGEPKGAILPHSCFDAAIMIHERRLTMLSDRDTSVSFLPMSHIFEKAWTYFCLNMGIRVWVNRDPRDIQATVASVRPTCMCSVPRFWEKVYTAVHEKIAGMGAVQRAVVSRAIKVGRRRNLDYARLGRKAPWWLEAQYRFFDKRVFSTLKRAIGIEHGNIFPTAGAPLSPSIVEFFHACGINIVIGYGLSETTATVTCFPAVGYEIGTVGTVLPGVEVKIGANDEILVKGPTVMRGYYNKPRATAEAFAAGGWLRTGDAGRFDKNGALILTERIKDLFKTSNGKYIAPQAIESRLGEDKYIEQVAVIGDQRKFVTAIIVPAFDALKEYARKKHIQFKSIDDLVKNADIHRMIEERIARLQEGLAGFEKIKKFTLLPREFTMESGELTNTLKIRRPVINHRYAAEIAAMYS